MKKTLGLIAAIVALLTVSSQAGQEMVSNKNVVPQMPPPIFGTGFYMALDMGANVHQDRGGDRTFTDDFGDTLTLSPKDNVGFFGGIKAGWVFGTGVFRPTIEGDFFYNGFRGGADASVTLADGDVVRGSTSTSYINTGAFMSNLIMRFAFDRFQPYVGGGVGVYYAESAGSEVHTPVGNFDTGGGASHSDLAWQVIAGADYYWNPKFSTFIEYHYLDYTSTQIDSNTDRDLGQHLIGAGLRFHF